MKDYEKELCKIIVNGNNVLALTGKTKCIKYAETTYEGKIKIQCVKDNVVLAEFENKLPTTETMVPPVVPIKPIGKEKTLIVGKSDLAKEQILLNDNNKNEEVTEEKYNLWQIIIKFFIDIRNSLFKKNSSQ